MRRSELIARLGTHAPCMFCHLPPGALITHGKGDAAFLLPALAAGIWGSPELAESDRGAINALFSTLLQCSPNVDGNLAAKRQEARPRILAIAAHSESLTQLCEEFFAALDE